MHYTGTDAMYESGAVEAALETLLWSETDDDDVPLDSNYGPEDVCTDDRRRLREAISAFINTEGVQERIERQQISPEQFGHDFILTANRHGAGYWDRGYGADGQWLTEMAHAYGEMHAQVNCRDLVEIYGI